MKILSGLAKFVHVNVQNHSGFVEVSDRWWRWAVGHLLIALLFGTHSNKGVFREYKLFCKPLLWFFIRNSTNVAFSHKRLDLGSFCGNSQHHISAECVNQTDAASIRVYIFFAIVYILISFVQNLGRHNVFTFFKLYVLKFVHFRKFLRIWFFNLLSLNLNNLLKTNRVSAYKWISYQILDYVYIGVFHL